MSSKKVCGVALIVGLLCLISLSSPVLAEEGALKTIQQRKAIVLGYLKDAYPMSALGESGTPEGFSIDLCRLIAQEVGKAVNLQPLEIRYVPVTLADRFDAVAQGKVDIECGTSTITLSRMEKVDFTAMTFLDGGSLLVRKSSAIHNLAALVDESVGVIPGTTTEATLRQALERSYINAKVVPVKDHSEGMAALEAGKISAYASDRVLLVGLLAKAQGSDRFGIAVEQFSYEPYGFAVRRNDSDFRLAANRALARAYRSGEVLKIFDKWFGKLGQPAPALIAMYLMQATPE
jgi:ABC-type amino acid transport substrate-binding protein